MNEANETLIGYYRTMLLIRRFEERLQALSQTNERPPGMLILCNGQEAVAAGVCAALDPEDVIVSNHRSHGHLLARGAEPKLLMAEVFGRSTGYNRGKSGTLHIAVPEINAPCTSTVVGGGIPIAAGIAFALQYERSSRVCACFFGEGASNEGSFHEAANLAAIWDLPVVFVCETNGYAGAQRFEEQFKIKDVAGRASAYGMAGRVVDGNDVTAVFEAAHEAVERARGGRGPTLLECKTYRLLGHGSYDHQHYVPREELDYWNEREPLKRLRAELENSQGLDEDRLANLEQEVGRIVDDAVRFANESPWPDAAEALEDLYA